MSIKSQADFYLNKAMKIENQLEKVEYSGNSSNVNRLFEVTEKLEKQLDIRIVELPACRMVTSGPKKNGNFKRF